MITMEAALSTAKATTLLINKRRRRHAIILQNGTPKIRALSDADQVRPAWNKPPAQLVGVYTAHANPHDIADDIIATAAGEYATRQARHLP